MKFLDFRDFLDSRFRWKLQKRGGRLELYPARIDALEHRLDLVRNARRDGAVNHPPAPATELGAFERSIIEVHGDLFQEATESYKEGFDEQKRMVSEVRAACQADGFPSCVSDTERNCRAALNDTAQALQERWKQVEMAAEDQARFRKLHSLPFEPKHYQGQLWKIAVLCSLMVGESLLNARMFGEASARGVLGGFGDAFIISFVSVTFSAGCGFLMRLGNAKRHIFQRIGSAARWGWGPMIASLHLTVGHYRDALVAGVAHPAQAAVTSMRTNPLDLNDLHSGILVLLGLMAAVVACIEGYRMDDPYPGYGSVARQVASAKDDYADLKFALLERISDIAAQGRADVWSEYDRVREALADCEDELYEALFILRKYSVFSAHIKASCVRLVRLYRDINLGERTDLPPDYFSEDVIPPFDMDPGLRGELERAEAQLGDIKTSDALRDLEARALEAERQIDALEDHYRDEAQALFDRIEGHARKSPDEEA